MSELCLNDKVKSRNNKVSDIRAKLKQNTVLTHRKSIILQKLQNGTLEKSSLNSETEINLMVCSFFDAEKLPSIQKNSKLPAKLFDENYKILEKIGEGAHGVVKKCESFKSGKVYTVKILKMDDEQIGFLKKNFINIQSLSNPSIIKYKGMYFDEKKSLCYLIMEYFPFPNLLEVQIETQEELKKIMKQVIETLIYLHKNKICHRDIKPENILYDKESGAIKIIDFGISKCTVERGYIVDMFTNTGTLYYKAPEMFLGGGYDCKVDLWALGVTIFKVIQKKTPFESTYHNQTIKNVVKGDIEFKDQIWQKYGFAKDLVLRLLRPASKRLSAEEARKHIWFDSSLNVQLEIMNSMLLLDHEVKMFNSIEEFLKNKSENMKNEKNGDIKKDMKMLDWLKEDFEGVDLTESLEMY